VMEEGIAILYRGMQYLGAIVQLCGGAVVRCVAASLPNEILDRP
jgi:hypothetical protein